MTAAEYRSDVLRSPKADEWVSGSKSFSSSESWVNWVWRTMLALYLRKSHAFFIFDGSSNNVFRWLSFRQIALTSSVVRSSPFWMSWLKILKITTLSSLDSWHFSSCTGWGRGSSHRWCVGRLVSQFSFCFPAALFFGIVIFTQQDVVEVVGLFCSDDCFHQVVGFAASFGIYFYDIIGICCRLLMLHMGIDESFLFWRQLLCSTWVQLSDVRCQDSNIAPNTCSPK